MAETGHRIELILSMQADADDPNVPASFAQLADFFQLFRGAYAASVQAVGDMDLSTAELGTGGLERLVRAHVSTLDVAAISGLFQVPLDDADLLTVDIWRENPWKIGVSGIATALVAAVIFSGGRIKAKGVEAELPPIGHGVTSLREALSPERQTSFSYGIRSRTVKLSKGEYDELFSYDPATKSRGGFQRLLISLQFRINKTTKELTLYENDIEMILKHGRNPKRGGFQRSIHRIFGRHFDLTPVQ